MPFLCSHALSFVGSHGSLPTDSRSCCEDLDRAEEGWRRVRELFDRHPWLSIFGGLQGPAADLGKGVNEELNHSEIGVERAVTNSLQDADRLTGEVRVDVAKTLSAGIDEIGRDIKFEAGLLRPSIVAQHGSPWVIPLLGVGVEAVRSPPCASGFL
mmetsp:Transcript_82466/g.220393  ORF Transcript_82466/g.220393 Transcript_82466/m.220393 type:complete len:156 (+) Transcript_82466:2-469(+)